MNQSEIFLEDEGDAFFKRIREANSDNEIFNKNVRDVLIDWCLSSKKKISSILEIGAGNGLPLSYLAHNLDAKAFGIDPSTEAVENWAKIRHKTKGGIRTKLKKGVSDDLLFEDSKFDLVVFGFCLYLIDRSKLFKSIAEADRVLKDNGLLAIIDFDVPKPYKNNYIHRKGINSYKNNYSNIFISSGHYALINKYSFSHLNDYFNEKIDERISLSLLFKQENTIYE